MTNVETDERFKTVCSEYIPEGGGVGELLTWLRKILGRELMLKEPLASSAFDYGGHLIGYYCFTKEPGTGYFRMEHEPTGLDHLWLVSELLAEQYGVDVDDPDIVCDLYEIKDLSLRCMNEFYQFKFYASHIPLHYEGSGSP